MQPAAPDNTEAAADPFAQVKGIVENLKSDLSNTRARIAILNAEIEALPMMHTPFEDLKAGILDICEGYGQRNADRVRNEIIRHAMGYGQLDPHVLGKPMQLGRLERATKDDRYSESDPSMIFAPPIAALFALVLDQARPKLAEIMDTITPKDLGYTKLRPETIGPSRAEMHRIIDEKMAEIESLTAHERDVADQLTQLGFNVSNAKPKAKAIL